LVKSALFQAASLTTQIASSSENPQTADCAVAIDQESANREKDWASISCDRNPQLCTSEQTGSLAFTRMNQLQKDSFAGSIRQSTIKIDASGEKVSRNTDRKDNSYAYP